MRRRTTIAEHIAAVIFDCDGVLINSWDSTMFYFNHVRAAVGLGPMDPEQEAYVFVHTVAESIRHIVPPERLDEALDAAYPMPFSDMLPLVRRQPGIRRLLQALGADGVKLAVNTNGGEEQHVILDHVGLHDRFDRIVTTADVTRGKPDPEGALGLLRDFGIESGQALFIGDSDIDRRTAELAGIEFWAFDNASLKAARHLDDFTTLIAGERP